MAKKSRRMRRAENERETSAPRVPYSTPVATPEAPAAAVSTAPRQAASASTARRAARAQRGGDVPASARLGAEELERQHKYIVQDLKRIGVLATVLFGALIALAFILPQVLG
jgi:hypothetical protein